MKNLTNVFAYGNFLCRMVLNLGLVFLVQALYGPVFVKQWLIYITFLASVYAIDGLLSQYFIRELIRSNSCVLLLRFQSIIYIGLGLLFSSVFFLSVYEDNLYLPLFMFAFIYCRKFDSHAKATLNPHEYQRLDLVLNIVVLLLVLSLVIIEVEAGVFLAAHMSLLTLALLSKYVISSKKKLEIISHADDNVESYGKDGVKNLSKCFVIAAGGSLSVNISLILVELANSNLSSEVIFSYRVGAIICEVASIPLIARMPLITRKIANGELSYSEFKKYFNKAIQLCVLGFSLLITASPFWNAVLPDGLSICSLPVLSIISLGWIFERITTLRSQYFMSLKEYGIYRVYLLYLLSLFLLLAALLFWKKGGQVYFIITPLNFVLTMLLGRVWKVRYGK